MATRTETDWAEGPRVLVVDDDPDVVALTEAYLGRAGCAVVGETDPEAALARFEAEPFDCVISDFRMTGTTGVDLCTRIRQSRSVPCAIFTSGDGTETRRQVEDAGFGLVYKQGADGYDRLVAWIREHADGTAVR